MLNEEEAGVMRAVVVDSKKLLLGVFLAWVQDPPAVMDTYRGPYILAACGRSSSC